MYDERRAYMIAAQRDRMDWIRNTDTDSLEAFNAYAASRRGNGMRKNKPNRVPRRYFGK